MTPISPTEPSGKACTALRRSALGGRRNSCWKVSLKRRMLPNPAASAISAIGRRVSWISCLANSTRLVCATVMGEAPRCCWNRRRNCRSPMPSRSASASTLAPSPSSAPSAIRARPRETVFEVPRHEPRSGAVSGRQRRQGRKPASCAAAALGIEPAILEPGGARRADRPAIDPGRGDADEQAPVEARVAALQRPVAGAGVEPDEGQLFHGPNDATAAAPTLAVFGHGHEWWGCSS